MSTEYDDDEVERKYRVFQSFLDSMTPQKAIESLRVLDVDEEILRLVREKHEQKSIQIIDMDEPPSVFINGHPTWYAGPDMANDRNWPALSEAMRKKNYGVDNIRAIDDSSTKIVALLEHPKRDRFQTKGLVVGFVQSGKTTNFTAVMAKAADRGYKLFIVLSGIHNTLRRQTQLRLVKDLVSSNEDLWYQVTNEHHDFRPPDNPKAFFASRGQTLLLVVKKNAFVLRKLDRWLRSAGEYLDNCPTLIIDDEADQSTVATKKIEPLLNSVMDRFPKVGYIGYTATPFANLLIDPSADNEFYPRNFIVNLPQPRGYQGPEILFGRDLLEGEDPEDLPGGWDMIREVPNEEVDGLKPKGKKDAGTFQPVLTHALRRAVEWFWLATAARRVRGGGNPHSTMLVHTTTETAVHEAFKGPLLDLRARTLRLIDAEDEDLVRRLRAAWVDETRKVAAADFGEEAVAFDDLFDELRETVRETRVVIDNYRSNDRLSYEAGAVTAIAVGGNTLSRGLTLEGLVSSLFVRAVSAYDTLLQMGRWFGYRDGYPDLPRIWMTKELSGWFHDLATVEADMRRDINRYMTSNETPMTFATRIRTHPKLSITSNAKMKHAVKASAAYGGHLVESRYFDVGPDGRDRLEANLKAAQRFLDACARDGSRVTEGIREQTALFTGVPYDDIQDFLRMYEFHPDLPDGDRDRLLGYIAKRVSAGALRQWSVGVIGNSRQGTATSELGGGVAVRMVKRGRLKPSEGESGIRADIKTLSSRRDELIDVQVDGPIPASRDSTLSMRAEQRPGQGLILVYPIEPESDTAKPGREPLKAPATVVVGVSILFPKPSVGSRDSEVEYMSADLSDVVVEQEDPSVLDQEQDDDVA